MKRLSSTWLKNSSLLIKHNNFVKTCLADCNLNFFFNFTPCMFPTCKFHFKCPVFKKCTITIGTYLQSIVL